MNILLINDNPVVSRLLVLCARSEHRVLEEVSKIEMIQHGAYDLVFVDEDAYKGDVTQISEILQIGKKILFTTTEVELDDFYMVIKKPFLPSQIMGIFETMEKELAQEEALSKTQVLDAEELEKIKTLLDMDDEIEEVQESLSEAELEARKVEAIKEQLIAEGLKIVEEEEIVDGLSETDEVAMFFNDDSIEIETKKKKKKKKKPHKNIEKKKKYVAFNEAELERIEDAVQVALATLKRKQMKKLLKGKKVEITIQLEGKH